MSEILNFRRSYYLTSRERSILVKSRLNSEQEVLLEDHITLVLDQWNSISIVNGYNQFIRIKITGYFPLKIMTDNGPFECMGYFSFNDIFPNSDNKEMQFKLKQHTNVHINKPQKYGEYLYGCIVSKYSTSIKLKPWFQEFPFDRFRPPSGRKKRCLTVQTQVDEPIRLSIRQNLTIDYDRKSYNIQKKKSISILRERIESTKRRKFKLDAQKLLTNYRAVLNTLQKCVMEKKISKRIQMQWIVFIHLIILLDGINQNFKLNQILKLMFQKNKVHGWTWYSKYRRSKISNFIKERTLVQTYFSITNFCQNIQSITESKVELVVIQTLKSITLIQTQNHLQQKLLSYHSKITLIQKYYRNKTFGFKLLIQRMIEEFKIKSNDALFTKQRLNTIIEKFYLFLCQKHKTEYNYYLNSSSPKEFMITNFINKTKKPKIRPMKYRVKLYEYIKLNK